MTKGQSLKQRSVIQGALMATSQLPRVFTGCREIRTGAEIEINNMNVVVMNNSEVLVRMSLEDTWLSQ